MFWASEQQHNSGRSAAELALQYGAEDVAPYTFVVVDRDDRDELVDFAVAKNDRGESLRPLFTYLASQATVLLALRDPTDNNTLVATVIGVPLTFQNSKDIPPMLLSTMLAVRALDRETGLTQKFLRLCFAHTARMGHAVRLFSGDRILKARSLTTGRIQRRIFECQPNYKTDALFQWGTVTPGNSDKWARFLNQHGPANGPVIAPAMLTHQTLFSCVLLSSKGAWEHAGVFLHAGESHVQLIYYGATTDARLLKFLRSVAAAVQKSVIVDVFHERLLKSLDVLEQETVPSTVLAGSSFVWYGHNLPAHLPQLPLLGLPMM
jgi:hypothetical protein